MVNLSKLPTQASRLFFVLIILQIPFFSTLIASLLSRSFAPDESLSCFTCWLRWDLYSLMIPCRSGICTTPIHVTSSQLVASDVFPVAAVKALLYPGAILTGLIHRTSIPSWNSVLDKYNLTDIKGASAMTDLQRLEVLAGSYFSVAGAFIGLLKPQRMSMFGTLLIVWGLVKEGILGKPVNTDPSRSVYVYPTMLIAVLCAFSSVKYNFQKAATKASPRPLAKPLKSSKKSKLK